MDGTALEWKQILAALRTGWWVILVALVLGGGAALTLTLVQTPLYASATQFFVSTTGNAPNQALQGSQLSEQRASSYARLIVGEDVAERLVDRLELDMSAGELRREITANAVADTVLIDVTVTDSSPRRAQRIAEALGEVFPEYVTELETRGGGGASPVQVTITDQPGLSATAVSPDPVRNIVLGLLAGFLVGVAAAVARARLDRSVKDDDQLAELLGAPVVGHVLRDDKFAERHVMERGAASRTAEDFRQLRNNLQWLNVDNPPKVIMITSALPSEGKTTTVVNLALALVDAGRSVAVVEADLRKPKVTEYLGLVGEVGLTNVLAGTVSLADVIQRYDDRDLWVVASGPKPPNPGELLASTQMQSLIEKLRGEYDYVLVDAPPVLLAADASGMAVHMDGVLLSVRYGLTRPEQLRQTAQVLERVRAKTLGVIFNIVPPKSDVAAGRGYGYAYDAS
jgi:receptor protein-tyrosine kinase